jgi:hypothetical protein
MIISLLRSSFNSGYPTVCSDLGGVKFEAIVAGGRGNGEWEIPGVRRLRLIERWPAGLIRWSLNSLREIRYERLTPRNLPLSQSSWLRKPTGNAGVLADTDGPTRTIRTKSSHRLSETTQPRAGMRSWMRPWLEESAVEALAGGSQCRPIRL